MLPQIKKAYEPGFLHGILTDVTQAITGDPGFREAYSNQELGDIFKVDPEGKEKGIYLDLVGILKHIGDKRKSEVKVTPEEEKDIELARKELKQKGMPSPQQIYEDLGQIRMKPIRFSELLSMKDTGGIYGLYYPGTDYIKISRTIEDNFKQSLGVATLVKQIGEKKVIIPPDREEPVKRILYGAYLSSGFIPEEDINTFYKKIQNDKDFRSRYIKAMMYPAYFIALHEGIHRNTFDKKVYKAPYGSSMLYENPHSPGVGLYLMYKAGEMSMDQVLQLRSILSYTFNTAEIDSQLSSTKRWYQIQTGKNISTIKDAEEALNYISKLVQSNEKLLDIVSSDVSNQYFAYNINRRMLEFLEKKYDKEYLETSNSTIATSYRDIRNSLKAYLYRLAQL